LNRYNVLSNHRFDNNSKFGNKNQPKNFKEEKDPNGATFVNDKKEKC